MGANVLVVMRMYMATIRYGQVVDGRLSEGDDGKD